MAGRGFRVLWRYGVFFAAFACAVPVGVSAQNLTAPQTTAPAPLTPGTGTPGATIANPTDRKSVV